MKRPPSKAMPRRQTASLGCVRLGRAEGSPGRLQPWKAPVRLTRGGAKGIRTRGPAAKWRSVLLRRPFPSNHHSVSKIQAAGIKQLASSAHIYDDAVLCDGDMPVRQGLDHADRCWCLEADIDRFR